MEIGNKLILIRIVLAPWNFVRAGLPPPAFEFAGFSIFDERIDADPGLSEQLQIISIGPGNRVFLSVRDTQHVFTRGARADFLHPGSIDEHGPVDANEAVR